MTTHYLKAERRWIERINADKKTCEVRLDDRDYQAGDAIVVNALGADWYSVRRTITHVLRGGQYGIEDGYVVLSLEDSRIEELMRLRRENEKLVRSNRALRARARRLTEQVKA